MTGGSQGIGKAIAVGLASFGCRVVVAARRADPLRDVVDEINGVGGEAVGVQCDLRVAADADTLAARADQCFGGIDILVNNVGGSFGADFRRGPLLELTEDDVLNTLRANVVTTFSCSRAAFPLLREGGGSIVNISSVVVRTPMPEFGAYSAAKAAVVSLTQTMAIEWAPQVRVNALLVGHVDTERTRGARSDEDVRWLQRHISQRRLGRPEDIAGAVAYLGSPLAGWVTGAAIPVDGGMRAI